MLFNDITKARVIGFALHTRGHKNRGCLPRKVLLSYLEQVAYMATSTPHSAAAAAVAGGDLARVEEAEEGKEEEEGEAAAEEEARFWVQVNTLDRCAGAMLALSADVLDSELDTVMGNTGDTLTNNTRIVGVL